MTFAALGTTRITRGLIQVPAWGAWWADLELDLPQSVTGQIGFTVADLNFSGTVLSGGSAEGKARYRIVGGKGGWGQEIDSKPYANDAGVKASTVLGDAAAACGEILSGASSRRIGPHFVRPKDLASFALHALEPKNWYVDYTGITRIGQRASSTYEGNAPRVNTDLARGTIELAPDSLEGFAPGMIVDGIQAADLEIQFDSKRLTARVWGAQLDTTRRLSAFQKLIRALLPELRYHALYEYRVAGQVDDRLNLAPVRTLLGMPSLGRVPIRPGAPGVRSNLLLGSLVLVGFVNADPARPVVVGFDAPDNPGWMPLTLELGGPGALGVARVTDVVTVGGVPGVISSGSLRVKAVV